MNLDLANELFGPRDSFKGYARYQRVSNALKIIGIGKSKLYNLIRKGLIIAKKVDGCTFVDLNSVASLFEACPQITPATYNTINTPEQLGLAVRDLPAEEPSESGSLDSIRLRDCDLGSMKGKDHA